MFGPGRMLLDSAADVVVEGQETLWRVDRGSSYMTVHHQSCHYLTKAKRKWPWHFADGLPLREVFAASWNIPCQWCLTKIESGKWDSRS